MPASVRSPHQPARRYSAATSGSTTERKADWGRLGVAMVAATPGLGDSDRAGAIITMIAIERAAGQSRRLPEMEGSCAEPAQTEGWVTGGSLITGMVVGGNVTVT